MGAGERWMGGDSSGAATRGAAPSSSPSSASPPSESFSEWCHDDGGSGWFADSPADADAATPNSNPVSNPDADANNTTVARCGISLTGSVGGTGASEAIPPAPPPRNLAWLLDATAGQNRRIDWRSGLGFTAPVKPASDAEMAWLRDALPSEFGNISMAHRRAAVSGSMRHAWGGYVAHAWPEDELAPLSKTGIEWLNVGLTIVDALDTLLIMGLEDEAEEARAWIASDAMSFDADKNANVFESTIRILGGLTSAHKLGGDTVGGGLLGKALDLAERLSPAFNTKTGIPIMDVNFKSGKPHQPAWTQKSSLSEAGTLVLEWEALEEALRQAENNSAASASASEEERKKNSGTGGAADNGGGASDTCDTCDTSDVSRESDEYEYSFLAEGGLTETPKARGGADVSEPTSARSTLAAMAGRTYLRDIASGARRAFSAVTDAVWEPANDGLVSSAVSAEDAQVDPSSVLTLGARGDSFYEYLLKHWIHSGRPKGGEAAYLRAMDGVLLYMLHRSSGDGDATFLTPGGAGAGAGSGAGAGASSASSGGDAGTAADAFAGGGGGQGAGVGGGSDGAKVGVIGKGARRRRWYSSSIDKDKSSSPDDGGEGKQQQQQQRQRGLLYVAEREGGVGGRAVHKMDHLVCFLPGVLALGHSEGLGRRWGGGNRVREWQVIRALQRLGLSKDTTHLDVARELARTCVQMYARTPAGLAPEIAHFPLSGLAKRRGGGGMGLVATGGGVSVFGDVLIKDKDSHNLLRPETVESLWVLWRITGESEWRDAGWRMWQAWERHARVEGGGYASLKSVTVAADAAAADAGGGGFERSDKMESFFLGETLKYLYLLFSDDPALLPLPCFVFNTEAHPLPVLTRGASDGGACVERVVKENIEILAAQHGL